MGVLGIKVWNLSHFVMVGLAIEFHTDDIQTKSEIPLSSCYNDIMCFILRSYKKYNASAEILQFNEI